MTKRARLGWIAIVFAVVGPAGGAFALETAGINPPATMTVTWGDTGETPAGAALVGRLTASGRNVSIWTTHNQGLLLHDVALFWYCSNGFGDAVGNTFTTSSNVFAKFSRNCPIGTTADDSVGIIDDL